MSRHRFNKLRNYIWPQHLRYQLALIFVAITSTAILAFTFHIVEEETETITQILQKDTEALADNIANASAQYLLVRDYTSIEGILTGAAKFPGITHIEISDADGKIVGAVNKNSNKEIEPYYGTPALVTPQTQDRVVNFTVQEMIIWQPIKIPSFIGWVRIRYDLEPIEQSRQEIWNDNIGDGSIIVLITFFLILIFLRRPTLSLTRYTDFAEHLNSSLGDKVEIDKHSTEFRKLGLALNRTSRRLKRQDNALNKLLTDLRRVAAMAEHSPNLVFSMNNDGEIVYSNQQAKHLAKRFSLTEAELLKLLPKHFDEIRQSCIEDRTIIKDIESEFQGLTYLWTFSSFHEQQVLHCYARDITERIKAQQEILHQANYDALTGLPNRHLALDRLEQAITRAHREQQLVCVMFIDLDRFKTVNDSFGHSIGDQLLVEVAKHLNNCVREGDTVARLGGDEFLIILDSVEEAINSEPIAEHILELLNKPFIFENNEFFVGASIGISIYPDDGEAPQLLLRNADTAMYKAKEDGRNNFHYFTQALNDKAKLRVKMESCLRHAIENHELYLEYQPQTSAQTGKLVGAEALIRWKSPELGQISPEVFIPLAEDTGLIIEIGDWVLNSACHDLQIWQKQTTVPLRIAINLSSRQFRSSTLLNTISNTLATTNIDPKQLELEITEGMLMDDSPHIINMLEELKRMDITLALDDFGTGYSSLSYLKRYPFDVLKIDRSFVRDISTDPDDAALCEAIIAIADSLGMKVVGEGVETREQLSFLFSRGVDYIQGYYYSKPLKADEFSRYLDSAKI